MHWAKGESPLLAMSTVKPLLLSTANIVNVLANRCSRQTPSPLVQLLTSSPLASNWP